MKSYLAVLKKEFEFDYAKESVATVTLPENTEVVLVDNSESHYNMVYQDFSTTIEKTKKDIIFEIVKELD